MDILFVTNHDGGRLRGARASAFGLDFTVASFAFEDLVRFRRAPDEGPVVNRRALDRAVAECDAFQGIFAEAPETVLLHYVRHKRGLMPRRWLVNVVNLLERVTPLRSALERLYGDDPLALAAADPGVRWGVTTRAHMAALAALGIPPERTLFHPSNTAIQAYLVPGARAALADPRARPLPPALAAVEGGVLVPGTNNRDLATAVRAALHAGIPIHVLGRDTGLPELPAPPRLVAYHGKVSLDAYATATAHARVVVVPLHNSESSCGQQTIAIAQDVRTLVVASAVPAVRDYVEDGVSGWLVPPEDPEALAATLARVLATPPDPAMLEAGHARNARDGLQAEHVLRDAFVTPLA